MKTLLERSGPIGRLPFFGLGVGLFALKVAIDYGVARLFGETYSVLYYVSPLEAPLMSPGGRLAYWIALWGVALPFIAVGVWLTLRRLSDARLPAWLAALFFVPFANLLFFLAVAVVPHRPAEPSPTATYRDAPPKPAPSRGVGVSILMAASAGAVVALGMVGISVGLLGEYGAALFIGAPTVSAFVATLLFGHLHGPTMASLFAALGALAISFVVMLGFAIEGLVCLVMASPLAVVAALVGWAVAHMFLLVARDQPRRAAGAGMVLLPIWLLGEIFAPLPPEEDRMVESVLEVDAPPEVVWERVLAFEDLPEPTELIFRAGVSAPTGAVISGEGVSAVRRCRFTTGEFLEPITVWDPGHELSFDVLAQPDPMREMTPYASPRPPHLDGYFATTRGQFLLEALPNGRTRLRGRTWYRLDVFPRPYWAFWADDFIHTIHLRVMRQIVRLAEADYAGDASAPSPRPANDQPASVRSRP
jgi:uncharacterized membrane protein YhaH (DUF805 family)